ncbi:MAG: JAB domain-containing protein [Sphingopyxis sp.]
MVAEPTAISTAGNANADDAAQDHVSALFQPYFAGSTREYLLIAGFDGAGRLCAFSETAGSADQVGTYRDGMRAVLGCIATRRILVAHNHVCGTAHPSEADRFATRGMAAMARLAGVDLCDHWLFAGGRPVSFRALGLIN